MTLYTYDFHFVNQAEVLLDRGIHPLRIAEGYEQACKISIDNLEKIAHSFSFSESDIEPLVQTCMTTLSSKMCVDFVPFVQHLHIISMALS